MTAQGEYAFSPSLAAYVQGNYSVTKYDLPLANGQPNRDSKSRRIIAGVNLDLSRLLRGTIGVGYMWRNYDSPIYRDINGFSVEAKLEYFPTQLTTFTVDLRRRLSDSILGTSRAFFDNRIGVKVDHSMRQNVIVTAEAQYGVQDYIGSDSKTDIFSISGGLDYALSRSVSINTSVRYWDRKKTDLGLASHYGEFQGDVGLTIQL